MKPIIAIVAGGDSSEHDVSMHSAAGLLSFMDHDKYDCYVVEIQGADWHVDYGDSRYPIDRSDFSFTAADGRHRFDFAYITIHGTPGENGILQGYFDLIGLPYSTSGVLVESLTFNKYVLNNFLRPLAGDDFRIADSVLVRRGCPPLGRLLQDAVNGLAGHAKGAGDAGHRFLHALAAADIPYLLRGQARLAALVFALGAGDGNALPLPFPDEGPFKFRHSANDLQMQPLEGRGVIGENEPFLVKTHGHPPVCHILKQMQQIPQIARQSVDAVHMQGIPLPQFRSFPAAFLPEHQ